ncbi:vacuolar protein sorting-associated protein 62 [Diplocarpon rosae]|nr:vacuolar protein sorting-associated protein 62 [Diplocarpon rosae]
MHGRGDETHEDFELGDLEDDAFLPSATPAKASSGTSSTLTRWIPPRLRRFLQNISKIKLVFVALILFVLALSVAAYRNVDEQIKFTIPEESLALRAELAKSLNGTSIPDYVLEYAVNFTAVAGAPSPLTLDNLNSLNDLGGESVFLSSKEDLVMLPEFLKGQAPDPKSLATTGAKSCAVIVVAKGSGLVDAFYMYFYALNDGPSALGHQVGSHLGDWEHNMVRFQHGTPTAVWFSQHEFGVAHTYAAVQKIGKRPVSFSARGSHANYPVADGLIPAHIIHDRTQQGKLWDPTLAAYYYTFEPQEKLFAPAVKETPVNWLYFEGRWGDDQFPRGREGQEEFHGYVKWLPGPKGPLDKHLDRVDVCPPKRECVVRD